MGEVATRKVSEVSETVTEKVGEVSRSGLSNIGNLWGQQKSIRSQYEPCEDSTLNCQEFNGKDSEDWGWGEDSGWSDVKSSSSIDKTSKKTTTSSSSTVGGLAAKRNRKKVKTNLQ